MVRREGGIKSPRKKNKNKIKINLWPPPFSISLVDRTYILPVQGGKKKTKEKGRKETVFF